MRIKVKPGDNTIHAQQVLHKIINNTCTDMYKTRRLALEATILSTLMGRKLTITDLGY